MGRIKGRICHRNVFYGAESSSGKRLELEVLMRIMPSGGYVMSKRDATSVSASRAGVQQQSETTLLKQVAWVPKPRACTNSRHTADNHLEGQEFGIC